MQTLARALVVFAASIILGIYAGLIALAVAMPYRVDLRPPVLIVSCMVAGISLCIGMVKWWEIEAGERAPRKQPAPIVRIEHYTQNGPNSSTTVPSDCPATPEQLYLIANRIVNKGAGVTYRDQQDLFSPQSDYKKLYDWFLQQGYSKDEGAGAKITEAGLEFFYDIYQPPNLTSPTQKVYANDTGGFTRNTHKHT